VLKPINGSQHNPAQPAVKLCWHLAHFSNHSYEISSGVFNIATGEKYAGEPGVGYVPFVAREDQAPAFLYNTNAIPAGANCKVWAMTLIDGSTTERQDENAFHVGP